MMKKLTIMAMLIMASFLVFSPVTIRAQESSAELAESLVGSTWNYKFQGTDFPIVFGKSTIEKLPSWKGVTWKATRPNQVQFVSNGNILSINFDSPNSFSGIDWDGKTAVKGKRISSDNSKTQGTNYLITPNSVGEIRLEMTVAEAKKALSNADFSPYQCDCAGDFDLMAIKERGKLLMTIGTDDGGKIYRITSRDERYELANGIGHGTPISEAEKQYGNIKEVSTAYDVETAEFTNHPKGIELIVSGLAKTDAGDYKNWKGGDPREKRTTKYNKDSYIEAVAVVRSVEETPNNSEYLITSDSVGNIRLGMTISDARKAMPEATFSRTSDGDGVALIAVKKGETELMTL